MPFDWNELADPEIDIAQQILGPQLRQPDLTIAPSGAGRPYLHRWHLVRTPQASVYFHVQVDDDPARPLHDHPWDNQSVILAGGYDELIAIGIENKDNPMMVRRHPGDVIWRQASWPHRLFIASGVKRTLTLFSTGPKVRDWGFWYPDGWKSYREVTRLVDGVSVHVEPTEGM